MTDWKTEWKSLLWMAAGFAACFWLPVGSPRFDAAVTEALALTRWYAREHVLLCLIPAFFIAGAIASFVSQAAVMKYLGPRAPKLVAYGVASVSGTILAVCSCTVLPLFAGIHTMGAGLGVSDAFRTRVDRWGVWGAAPLGLVFALAFCPVSAGLFFGGLVPLATGQGSALVLPAVYGVGTALPVAVFAVLLAIGVSWLGTALDRVQVFERWARPLTAAVIVAIGVYETLRSTLGLI